MKQKSWRPLGWTILLIAISLGALLMAIRVYWQVVPRGLRPRAYTPFFFASVDHGLISSPAGTHPVHVVVNDAGAMHSGNHWMWVIEYSPLTGRHILTEGYIANVDYIPDRVIPLRWVSDNEFEITFCKGRRSWEKSIVRYTFPD
ncbi:MAG TPA: hypothetical protein VH682_24365 [Gemmataceae bacterium]|jgi:hypothetical protein